ncbi:MAG: hypothetical protein ACTSPI_00155 [Candidatus Heimdallarchaeaceae archaeon]
MSYKIETSSVQGRTVTANFLRKIDEGHVKEAADASTQYIRQQMQGEGILRQIMEPIFITEDQLDLDEDTDQPKKIVEKDQLASATFIPFYGSAEKKYFTGPKYSVYFGKIESDHFYKSKFELMTYRNDIRQLLSDSCIKALTDGEDQPWFDEWNTIVDAAPAGTQKFALSGGLTAENVYRGVQALLDLKIPHGKIVCSKTTFLEVMKLDFSDVGSEILAKHYKEGVAGEESLWGLPVITTIKDYVVPNNELWFFGKYAPAENANFLGNFFTIQDATLFLEQKADMLEFYAYSAPGVGIGNILSGVKVTI